MASKRKCERRHAARRAADRFGICLSDRMHADIVGMIQAGAAKFVERQSNRCTVWDVVLEGKECRVVYDKERKQLVTFLYRTVDEWMSHGLR